MCLVNRYWARICRRRLHRVLFLRSAANLQKLCSIVDSTPPALTPIIQLVNFVRCTVKDTDIPWLHLVREKIVSKTLDALLTVNFHSSAVVLAHDLAGDPPRGLRPLHPGLPRTLPRQVNTMCSLTLHGTQFRDAAQLCCLIRSVNRLSTITFDNVTWLVALDEYAFFPFSLCGMVEDITMAYSSMDVFNPCWMLPAFLRASPRAFAVQQKTWPAKYSLLHKEYHTLLKIVKDLGSIREDHGPAELVVVRYHGGNRRLGALISS